MATTGPAKRLIVTISEAQHWHGRQLHHALLELFRHRRLPRAMVSRGIAGYEGRGRIHTINLIEVATELPIRIEVVGTAEAIDRVLPDVYDMVEKGLVEVQDTTIVKGMTTEEPPGAKKGDLVRLIGKAKMLRVHIGQNDRWEGAPLYEAIVKRAAQLDIAGATAYRGILGYGAHRRIHRHKAIALSSDDPIMISMVDDEEKITKMLAALETMVSGGCMIAISDVTVVKYVPHADGDPHGPEDA
jgi:PII-like signaling protein